VNKDQATELTVKIRWAIGTSLGGDPAFKLVYREQMSLASLLTDDIAGVMSALRHSQAPGEPSSRIDRELLRNLLTQVQLRE